MQHTNNISIKHLRGFERSGVWAADVRQYFKCVSISNIHSFLLPGSIPEINFPLLLLSLLFLCFLLLLSSSPSALYCVTRLHVSGTTLQGAEWVDAKGLYNNMNNIYISLPLGNVPESDSHYYYNV